MAICATTHYAGVIHCTTAKAIGIFVTGLASSRRLNMIAWFTFSGAAVMAISATRGDTCMVHCATNEAIGVFMTGFT